MIKIGILGASGRMGKTVQELLKSSYLQQAELCAQASQGEALEPLLKSEAVIDFSAPAAAVELIKKALLSAPLPVFILGSTGWKIDDLREIENLSKKTAIVLSSNFSLGVMAFTEILKSGHGILEKLKYTPVILETHHRHKKDMPSGTAISLQRVISPMGPGNVQTHSVRAGEVVGEHEVRYYGANDQMIFSHSAKDRSIFARGAIEVALWLAEKKAKLPGLTGMLPLEQFFKEKYQ